MKSDFVFFPAFFGMISFVIWVVVNGWQRRQQLRLTTEFTTKVLDRLGSTKDFSEFLHSEGGDRLMKGLTAERRVTGPHDRILMGIQSGVVFITVGLGLCFVAWRAAGDEHEVLTVISTIVLSLGVGLMLSSAASFWVAKNLGMFEALVDR